MKRTSFIPTASCLLFLVVFAVETVRSAADSPSSQHAIAVLPFETLGGNAEHDHISAVTTHNVIHILSKVPDLLLVAAKSPTTDDLMQIAKDNDVRYVLSGGIKMDESQMELTARLRDSTTAETLWSDTYARDQDEIFDVHDALTQQVVSHLGVTTTSTDKQRIWHRQTSNLEAYRDVLDARKHFLKFTEEEVAKAQQLSESVVEKSPEFAYAWTQLGYTHALYGRMGWSSDANAAYQQASEMARKALASDEFNAGAYGLLGSISRWQNKHEESVKYTEKAVALNPNDANNTALLAGTLTYVPERYEEADALIDRAIRLAPAGPVWYTNMKGWTSYKLKKYDEAATAFKKYTELNPEVAEAHANLAMVYATVDQIDMAKSAAAECLRLDPNFTIKNMGLDREPDVKGREIMQAALIKAGIPK